MARKGLKMNLPRRLKNAPTEPKPPHQLNVVVPDRVPLDDAQKLAGLPKALDALLQDERLTFRRLTKIEVVFSESGQYLFRVFRQNEGSFSMSVDLTAEGVS